MAMITATRIAIFVLAAGLGGCLERDITITTEPPGALVRLNDVEVGRTPVTVPFTWYGDYDVVVRLDGYKTILTHAGIYAPFWEYPPIDLVAEIQPWTIRDNRYLDYKMEKMVYPPDEELKKRAAEMQKENLKPPR